MIPLNPFRFTRKHHNYANYNKNIISVFTYVTSHQKNGLTPQKDTLPNCKVATGIYVTTPHPIL